MHTGQEAEHDDSPLEHGEKLVAIDGDCHAPDLERDLDGEDAGKEVLGDLRAMPCTLLVKDSDMKLLRCRENGLNWPNQIKPRIPLRGLSATVCACKTQHLSLSQSL